MSFSNTCSERRSTGFACYAILSARKQFDRRRNPTGMLRNTPRHSLVPNARADVAFFAVSLVRDQETRLDFEKALGLWDFVIDLNKY
jgi:hypothetical protein